MGAAPDHQEGLRRSNAESKRITRESLQIALMRLMAESPEQMGPLPYNRRDVTDVAAGGADSAPSARGSRPDDGGKREGKQNER